jgi:hypothetical protein
MHRRRTISLGLALAAVAVGVAIIALGRSSFIFHAESRLKLKVKSNGYFPIFDRDEYAFMSQFLSRTESRLALATATGVEEKSFRVDNVGPVRGTSLFHINCSGTDSNKVQCVASNAAYAIMVFYATNQPTWELTYIDTGLFIPPTFWERLKGLAGL